MYSTNLVILFTPNLPAEAFAISTVFNKLTTLLRHASPCVHDTGCFQQVQTLSNQLQGTHAFIRQTRSLEFGGTRTLQSTFMRNGASDFAQTRDSKVAEYWVKLLRVELLTLMVQSWDFCISAWCRSGGFWWFENYYIYNYIRIYNTYDYILYNICNLHLHQSNGLKDQSPSDPEKQWQLTPEAQTALQAMKQQRRQIAREAPCTLYVVIQMPGCDWAELVWKR